MAMKSNYTTARDTIEFEALMRENYEVARRDYNLPSSRFIQAIDLHGGRRAAKRFLLPPNEQNSPIPEPLYTLHEIGQLRLSVEAAVIQPRFETLFKKAEIEIARWRLDQFGYSAD